MTTLIIIASCILIAEFVCSRLLDPYVSRMSMQEWQVYSKFLGATYIWLLFWKERRL